MMKKKILLRFIIYVLIIGGFIIACNHMPLLIGAVYDSVFKVISFPAFMFCAGLLVFELIILKKYADKKQHYYIIFSMIFGVSSIFLFHGHASLYDKLTPQSNTTLMGRLDANMAIARGTVMQYYFDNKEVVVPREVFDHKQDIPFVFSFSVSPHDIRVVDEEEYISKETEDILLSYPHFTVGTYSYVIDEYWKKTNSIRLLASGEEHIFCSQEIMDAIERGNYKNVDLKKDEGDINNAASVIRDIELARPYKKLKQIVVMSLLFMLGMLITLPIWGEKYPLLTICMSLPVSAASLCIYGMILMVFNIPYNLYTIFACCALLIGIWTYKNRDKYKSIAWSEISNWILIAIAIIIFLVYGEICFTTYDSVVKCALGYRLAIFGSLRECLLDAAPYGMLEPMIMSLGYMVHCDLLYTFYPLMIISGLGLMCAGLYYINNKKYRDFSMLVLFGGMLLLITNYDFLLSAFYVMAHGPIAVYTLISVMFIMLKRRINIDGFEYVVILSASMILLTRVEGAIYVLFMLIASLGLENERLKLQKVNITLGIATIFWNVYQIIYIGKTDDTLFWNPTRGLLLIGASLVMIICTLCFSRTWGILKYIKKNYYGLLSIVVVGGTAFASMFMERSMASLNMPVFLAHLSNNAENDTNSAAIWIFVCMMFVLLLSMGTVIDKYTIVITFGYLMSIFVVCLFRYDRGEQLPLRLGFYDSSRRTIVQIMPTVVWLIACCLGEAGGLMNKVIKD